MAKKDEGEAKKESTRRTYRNDDWTEDQVKARRAELTVEEAPAGWVKVSEVSEACRAAKIPVSKFVRAFGGDRGMNPPAHKVFTFVYVGRTRYVAPEALTTGLEMLTNPEFLKTTRKKKAKAEGEGTGPVASAKKAKVKRTVKRPTS
jgi:hypothetical protein